jgi:hypothetical protein
MQTISSTQSQDLNLEGRDFTNIPQNINKTYSTMHKLICGALVGGTNYSDVYVGYQTDKFLLPVTPLTVSVRVFFAFIFGNVFFLPVM